MKSELDDTGIVQVVQEIKSFQSLRHIHSIASTQPKPQWCVVSSRSAGKYRWDIFILVAALYNCIVSPYLGTFAPSAANTTGFIVMGILIDTVFLIDLLLSFFTTYTDDFGREVTELPQIRKKYVQGKFMIDAVAAVPIEIITVLFLQRGTVLYVVSVLRILRLSRLGKIFFYLRVNVEVKITLRMVQLLGFLLVYIHMMACSWFFLVKQDKTWDGLVYTVYKEGSIYDEDAMTQYWLTFYVGLYMLLGVEIYPTSLSEYIFMSIAVLIGALIMTVILGDMVVLISAMSQETKRYNAHYDKLNEVMKTLNLPSGLQREVVSFYVESFYTLKKNLDYRKLLGFITQRLQQEVVQQTCQSFFSTNAILQNHKDAWKFVILAFRDAFYKPGEVIISQFSCGKEMNFIIKGKCLVVVQGEDEAVHRVRVLSEGDSFGEIALLYNTSRTASVYATAHTYTLQLSERYFHYFCQQSPEWRQSLVQKCASYNDPYRQHMLSLLQRVPYFDGLSIIDTQQILYAGHQQFYTNATSLFDSQGVADRVYIILSGSVDILFPLKHPSSFKQSTKNYSLSTRAAGGSEPYRLRQVFSLKLDTLGCGSVISPIKVLVQHKNIVDCQAASQVVTLEYTLGELNTLAEQLTALRINIHKIRAKTMYFDRYCNEYISNLIPLDYIKFLPDESKFTKWRRWALFKEAVLRKIIYQRTNRLIFKVNWATVMAKLRATVKVERRGFPQLVAKIVSGEVHPHISDSLQFISQKESNNPVILQLAVELMRITHAKYQEEEDMKYLRMKFLQNSRLLTHLRTELTQLKQLCKLYMLSI